jgi:pantetheine-phosphate adenylyltransferase
MTDRKDLDLAAINKERIALGLGNLQYLSLPEIAAGAYDDAFYFLEDPAGHVPRFRNVACGGTFDHLHNGHKKLLTLAASCCDGVLTVGVTSDSMLKAKEFAFLLESSEQRVARVKDFLQQIRPDLATRVVVITDPLGPPGVEADFDAIVVSSETIGGGLKINDVRKDRGFPPMQVLVTRRTTASTLSSSFVRQVIHKRAQPGW